MEEKEKLNVIKKEKHIKEKHIKEKHTKNIKNIKYYYLYNIYVKL